MTLNNPPIKVNNKANPAKIIWRAAALTGMVIVMLGAGTLALPTNTLPIARADSATDLCGQQVTSIDPTNGLSAVSQLAQQGNNQIVSSIVNGTGLGAQWCGPVQWLTGVAAEVVVNGTLLEVVDVHTPTGLDIAVAAARSAIEQAQGGQPATLPDVGGSGSTVWAPVTWATAGINIRPEPDTNMPPIGNVPDGVPLLIQCSTYGESTTSAGGTTNVWDQVTYNGVTGYVADAFIDTGQLTPVAPSC